MSDASKEPIEHALATEDAKALAGAATAEEIQHRPGLDAEHRAAVGAILTALSQTSDCRALERAARSVDRIAKRHAKFRDAEETGEMLQVYLRRLLSRAADVCTSFKDASAPAPQPSSESRP